MEHVLLIQAHVIQVVLYVTVVQTIIMIVELHADTLLQIMMHVIQLPQAVEIILQTECALMEIHV